MLELLRDSERKAIRADLVDDSKDSELAAIMRPTFDESMFSIKLASCAAVIPSFQNESPHGERLKRSGWFINMLSVRAIGSRALHPARHDRGLRTDIVEALLGFAAFVPLEERQLIKINKKDCGRGLSAIGGGCRMTVERRAHPTARLILRVPMSFA